MHGDYYYGGSSLLSMMMNLKLVVTDWLLSHAYSVPPPFTSTVNTTQHNTRDSTAWKTSHDFN